MLYPTFKIDKPIRLIELFAGYGSQALALKYLGVSFEHWKICEWAVKSIQAYKDIHFTEDTKDYSKGIEIRQIKEFLVNKGISSNYNEPMSKEQINRLNEKQTRTIYNNIQATHNLVNIQQVKGSDLEISDTDKYEYILTYSFPCQDLSLAGNRKGMSDTTTRSGLLWEVERILTELEEKPQVLLMENVPQVHGEGAIEDFNKWQFRLEELGYKNYWQDLIATDYGIPQTRNRTFMVSILGDYNYTFPKPIPLKLKLKDMLEDEVDEKYYLSEAMQKYIFSEDDKYKVNQNSLQLNREIACSKTTREGWTRADTSDYITCLLKDKGKTLSKITETANTLMARDYKGFGNQEMNGVITIGNYSPSNHNASRIVDQEYFAPTVMENHGTITAIVDKPKVLAGIGEKKSNNNTQWYQQDRIYDDNVSISLTTQCNPYYKNNLRIRKLTPKECFRLMGVKDEDFNKVAKNQSDSSLYHLAGDSIVVNVLMAIFKELL